MSCVFRPPEFFQCEPGPNGFEDAHAKERLKQDGVLCLPGDEFLASLKPDKFPDWEMRYLPAQQAQCAVIVGESARPRTLR